MKLSPSSAIWAGAAPSAETAKHEVIIVVGVSRRDEAMAGKAETLAALARQFPDTEFEMTVVGADCVDGGRFLVIPCRGKIGGDEPLKPLPPAELIQEVEEALRDLRFLEPPVVN